jgi:23S rRNA pseudouridine2605 synthase
MSTDAAQSTSRSQPRHRNQSRPPTRLFAKKKSETFRADRVLAQRTGKSRSECFKLLTQKRIFERVPTQNQSAASNAPPPAENVEDAAGSDSLQDSYTLLLVPGPSSHISLSADLVIDKTHAIPQLPPILQVYHKPKWVLSVRNDPNRACLAVLPDMHPVGRLDYDSTGLLLFSSHGPLTQRLLHPKHGIPKEYQAVVVGRVDHDDLSDKLATGVETADGIIQAQLVSTTVWPTDTPDDTKAIIDYLKIIRQGLPAHYNQTDLLERGYLQVLDTNYTTTLSTVSLIVSEGKYRMVRRILANSGHPVVSLHRTQIGPIKLGDLAVGETRVLTAKELAWAESLVEPRKKSPPPMKKKQSEDGDGRNNGGDKDGRDAKYKAEKKKDKKKKGGNMYEDIASKFYD